jgi:hypothetical protein
LATEAGLIAGRVNTFEFPKEMEENGFNEVPVFGVGSEEAGEPEVAALFGLRIDLFWNSGLVLWFWANDLDYTRMMTWGLSCRQTEALLLACLFVSAIIYFLLRSACQTLAEACVIEAETEKRLQELETEIFQESIVSVCCLCRTLRHHTPPSLKNVCQNLIEMSPL